MIFCYYDEYFDQMPSSYNKLPAEAIQGVYYESNEQSADVYLEKCKILNRRIPGIVIPVIYLSSPVQHPFSERSSIFRFCQAGFNLFRLVGTREDIDLFLSSTIYPQNAVFHVSHTRNMSFKVESEYLEASNVKGLYIPSDHRPFDPVTCSNNPKLYYGLSSGMDALDSILYDLSRLNNLVIEDIDLLRALYLTH